MTLHSFKSNRKPDENVTVAFEIDLKRPKLVMNALDVNKLDCYPILWVWQAQERIRWPIELDQRVVCKYLAIKLIDIHRPQNEVDSLNFDMFPLEVEGFALKIPTA